MMVVVGGVDCDTVQVGRTPMIAKVLEGVLLCAASINALINPFTRANWEVCQVCPTP